MKIIISPAKKMKDEIAYLEARNEPQFLNEAKQLLNQLKSYSYDELKALLECSDAIAKVNYERYQKMDLESANTPALLAYEGIAYQYMAPQVFEEDYFEYVEKHLRMLSGFYGILRPFDAVTPYRLEMQAKMQIDDAKNLYVFWKDRLYQALDDSIILNLASHEYSKAITPYLKESDHMVTCVFGELINGKVKEKGVYVKMARGEMVRYLAENRIETLEGVKGFNRLGFVYHEELSDEYTYVFIGTPPKKR